MTGLAKRDVPRGLLGELAREMHAVPGIAPRLSVSPDDPPCTAAAGSHPGCAPTPTAAAPPDRVASIAARASQAIRERADPNALHTVALIDLLYGSGEGKSLQRAISSLQTAARLTDRPAPVLADLAAAYLIRAEHASRPRDLAAAIEAAEQALELERGNYAALFNRALALEWLHLQGESVEAWRDYLVADSASAWADDAHRHLHRLLALRVEPAAPAPGAPLSAYEAYAADEPQRARELGWCRVLGSWADAALQGDAAGAEELLRRAEALGTSLERRPGGDATLADGIRSIHARTDGPRLRRLARAHQEFAAACVLERRVNFRAAGERFAAAGAAAEDSPTLRAWARLHYGGTVFHGGDIPGGRAVIGPVARAADTARHPALAGRARLLLAVIEMRSDAFQELLEQATRARALFRRAGEQELEGAALEAMFVAHVRLGDPDGGYALAHQGLQRLRSYPGSYRLHNLLSFTARTLGDDGFPRAALRVQDEDVRVTERNGEPVYAAEARLARARLHAIADSHTAAARDLVAARAALALLPDPDPRVRRFLVSRQQIAEARGLLRTHPARAARALDSAAAFFLDTMGSPFVALPAMVDAAYAHLATGDAPLAMERLEAALAVLERRRDRIRMEPRRAAVFEQARALVDRMTLLKLAAGRTNEALAYLDRGRASLATVGAAASAESASEALAAPPGEVALVYARMADTLLAWTVVGERVEVARTVVDTARLLRTIERVRQQMEEQAGDDELRAGLSELYESLVRPVQARLGGAETPLVVVADGDLGAVPFPALYDARRRRYLVQDHPLRFVVSLRQAWRPARRPGRGTVALFVADPAFDARANPGFPRLAQAREEARQSAEGYRGVRVLSDAGAHGGAVRAALDSAGLVHYAGHAVFDDERPERSYLLLAPTPGDTAGARLHANEVAQMDLRHLSLVVLSACQTVRTGPGRAAGFSGLAGAFLAAGAGGALGSLWQVDDRHTLPLMVEFHRAFRRSGHGPAALRQAQLHLLRSNDPRHRSPSTWAAFRYVGN